NQNLHSQVMEESFSYPGIMIPLTKSLDETTSREAKEYLEWFLSVKEERIQVLAAEVNKRISWSPDYTRDSLYPLGDWLKKTAYLIPISMEEKRAELSKWRDNKLLTTMAEGLSEKMSGDTHGQCFDLGFYFA